MDENKPVGQPAAGEYGGPAPQDFVAQPVPARVREELERVGREMSERHAAEGMPAATLRREQTPPHGFTAEHTLRVAELVDEAREHQEHQEHQEREVETHRARALLEISSELPDTLDRAMVSTHAALLRWRGLALEAREAATAFYQEDVRGSSIRIRCTELLQVDEIQGEPGHEEVVRKAMSYSAADKAASDHPLYQAHKLRRLELGSRKAETERRATEALETLHCQQLYLKAMTAQVAGEGLGDTRAALEGLQRAQTMATGKF